MRVDTDEATRDDDEARLLANFARDRVGHRLADFDRATGQSPLSTVRSLLEQEPTATIEDDSRNAGTNAESPLVVTLEGDHRHTVPDERGVRNIRRR